MKFGIITLVSDNYGNKYQNYAVEQLISEYGSVETFALENLYTPPKTEQPLFLQKIRPKYILDVITSRLMYKYDINRTDKGIIYNVLYTLKNHKKILTLKNKRHEKFVLFSKENLHISEKKLNENNTDENWTKLYDYFICGSDQIWNPNYGTISDLAFCSFAPEKTVCLSPSFGVSEIPEYRKNQYAYHIGKLYSLSVRENAGKKIIKELTGRDADVLVDPTMALPLEKWENLCRKPEDELPRNYIVCYFLGKLDKTYKKKIEKFATQTGLPTVILFDVMSPEYYTYDPSEVLYTIKNAEYVLTDSFHGTVFSILFRKNFYVFERNEGGSSMGSRISTLLKTFSFEDRIFGRVESEIDTDKWKQVNSILESEREKIQVYLSQTIRNENR